MGVIIPQVVSASRATGAQVIDGSLKFDSSKGQFLKQTFVQDGNKKTFTYSFWAKKTLQSQDGGIIFSGDNNVDGNNFEFRDAADKLRVYSYQNNSPADYRTTAEFRDTSGWKHFVVSIDSTASDRMKLYVNGERVTSFSLSTGTWGSNTEYKVNTSGENHYIGLLLNSSGAQSTWFDGQMSQFYFIDGQALGPENFGFTDGLTNTWKPKKYEGTFGTNGCYLPFDGNSPIGEDKSGVTTPNDGTFWSKYVTISEGSTGTNYNEDASAWFDGDTSNAASLYSGNMVSPYSPTTVVFTPPSPITVSTGVRVYMAIDRGQNISINGTETNASVSAGWNDTGFTGTLTSLTLGPTNAGSSSNPSAIEIDGVILVDGLKGNSWTPVNFGGSVAFDNPIVSGALPILNTTQGGTQAGVGVRTDPNYANLVLALPLVGNADDVSNQINSGSTTKVVTVDGAVASSAFSNFYSRSFEFDGTDDDLTIPDSADFNFGADDFTMEMWVYSDASQTKEIMGQRATGQGGAFSIYHTGANILLYVGSNGSSWDIVAGATIATSVVGQWTHIAIVRNGNHFLTFQDGVHKSTTVDDGTIQNSSSPLSIGSNAGNYFFDGKLSDIRIYKGVAKYTSDFVVPSTSPHILPDTPSGVSGGSKLTKTTDGAVYFDGTGDYLSMSQSTDFAVGTGDFTFECFVYSDSTPASWQQFFSTRGVQGSSTGLWFGLDNSTRTPIIFSGTSAILSSSRDIFLKTWNHIAYVRNNGTLKLYLNGKETASVANTTNFSDDYGSIGAETTESYGAFPFNGYISNLRLVKGTAVYTSEFTPPTEPLTNVTNTKLLCCQSSTSATAAAVAPTSTNGTGYTGNTSAITLSSASLNSGAVANIVDGDLSTEAQIRGAGSYVQMVFPQQQNGTLQVYVGNGNDVNDDDIRVFIDGVEGTSFDTSGTNNPPSPVWHTIHTGNFTTVKLEHQGSTTGYIYGFRIGTSGDTIINASGGITSNGDEAATNFNPFITDIHAVRGQETGYATLNPLIQGGSTLSDGNLTATAPAGATHGTARSTLTMDTSGTGKFYFEATLRVEGGTYPHIGVLDSIRNTDTAQVGSTTNCFSYMTTGSLQLEGASASAYGDTYTVGDTIGCSLDCGSGELRFYKNGVDQGVAKTITTQYDACFAVSNFGSSGQWKVNFGQKPFKFPPPDGFQPLNAANARPETVISRPDQYVGVMTYMSNNDTLSKNDYKFKPDLLIFKNLDTANHWGWFDSVRGANKQLSSNRPNAEITTSGVGYGSGTMNSFDPFGFTLGDDVGSNTTNYPADNEHVVYGFKAGGDKNTFNVDDVGYVSAAAAGLTGGGYAVTGASVGTKQGFSIMQWEHDATVGGYSMPHGLTQTPKFIITRNVDISSNWGSYHYNYDDGAGTHGLNFNSSSVPTAQAGWWNDTGPTNTQFSLGTFFDDAGTYIAYLWHDVPGLQKFGTYQGNGSADGPFVELGFRPAIVMVKYAAATGSASWFIYDSERGGKFNPINGTLIPNSNGIEENAYDIDFLSNGFKLKYADAAGYTNYSAKYIYCAWAEAPSIDLFGGGANAR